MKRTGHTALKKRAIERPQDLPRSSIVLVQLITTSALVLSIGVVATAISIGFARAQALGTIQEPDTALVLTMMALAILVMGVLSAAAVRLVGRSRQR